MSTRHDVSSLLRLQMPEGVPRSEMVTVALRTLKRVGGRNRGDVDVIATYVSDAGFGWANLSLHMEIVKGQPDSEVSVSLFNPKGLWGPHQSATRTRRLDGFWERYSLLGLGVLEQDELRRLGDDSEALQGV